MTICAAHTSPAWSPSTPDSGIRWEFVDATTQPEAVHVEDLKLLKSPELAGIVCKSKDLEPFRPRAHPSDFLHLSTLPSTIDMRAFPFAGAQ